MLQRLDFTVLCRLLCPPFVAILLAAVLTRWFIVLLPSWGMMDIPKDGRRVHSRPVPRGGGLAFILSFILVVLACALLFPRTERPYLNLRHMTFLSPAVILLVLGILDDRFTLNARVKFLFQIIASFLAWLYCDVRIEFILGYSIPVWASACVSVFWIVAMINAFNMIDGIDGLAAGIAIISGICMGILPLGGRMEGGAAVLFIFAGSCCGFLLYNRYPARVFMGDTGSMFLGYFLGCVGILLNVRVASVSSFFVPLLFCGIPVLDICMAVWRRIITPPAVASVPPRSVWWRLKDTISLLGKGDKSHLHHRLLKYFHNNQPKTVHYLYFLATLLGVLGILCFFTPGKSQIFAYLVSLLVLSLVLHRLAVIELWNTTERMYLNFSKPQVGVFLNCIYPLLDFLAIFLAVYWIFSPAFLVWHRIVLLCLPVFSILLFSRTYRVFWNFPSANEDFRLALTLGLGFLSSWGLLFLFRGARPRIFPHFAAWAIASVMVVGSRMFWHYLRRWMIDYHYHAKLLDTKPTQTLLYGICWEAGAFYRTLITTRERLEHETVIGIIDMNRNYRQGYCLGFRVLGVTDDLEKLYQKGRFDKIVICCQRVFPEEQRKLLEFAQSHGVKLCQYRCQEIPYLPSGESSH